MTPPGSGDVRVIRGIFALVLAVAASAQERDPEEVLARARDKILERTEKLPNYTCVQTVDRSFLRREQPVYPVPSCELMSAEKTKKAYTLRLEATDRLRLDVKVSDGNEIGSWAGNSRGEGMPGATPRRSSNTVTKSSSDLSKVEKRSGYP